MATGNDTPNRPTDRVGRETRSSPRGFYLQGGPFPANSRQLSQIVALCPHYRVDTLFLDCCGLFPWSLDPRLGSPYGLTEQMMDGFQHHCYSTAVDLVPVLPGPGCYDFLVNYASYSHFCRRSEGKLPPLFDIDAVGSMKMMEDLIDDLLSLMPNTETILVELDRNMENSEAVFPNRDYAEVSKRFVERVSEYLESIGIGILLRPGCFTADRFDIPLFIEEKIPWGDPQGRKRSTVMKHLIENEKEPSWMLFRPDVGMENGLDLYSGHSQKEAPRIPLLSELFSQAELSAGRSGVAVLFPTTASCDWCIGPLVPSQSSSIKDQLEVPEQGDQAGASYDNGSESGKSDGERLVTVISHTALEYAKLMSALEEGWDGVRSFQELLVISFGDEKDRYRAPLEREIQGIGERIERCRYISGGIVQEIRQYVPSEWLFRWQASLIEPLLEEHDRAHSRFRQIYLV